MQIVELKSQEQLDIQTLHRVRSRLVAERTTLINQLRAVLLERGVIFAVGRVKFESALDGLLAEAGEVLSARIRSLVIELRDEWRMLDKKIEALNAGQSAVHATSRNCAPNKSSVLFRRIDGRDEDLLVSRTAVAGPQPPGLMTQREYWNGIWTGAARDDHAEEALFQRLLRRCWFCIRRDWGAMPIGLPWPVNSGKSVRPTDAIVAEPVLTCTNQKSHVSSRRMLGAGILSDATVIPNRSSRL